MNTCSMLPPEIPAICDRLSREELQQIGQLFLDQAQNYVDKQQQTRVFRSSLRRSPIHPPRLYVLQWNSRGPHRYFNSKTSGCRQFRRSVKRFKNNEQSPGVRQPAPHPTYRRFNMSVLKCAVSCILPSFFITLDPSSNSSKPLSSIQVAILLKNVFAENQTAIKELSLCVQSGVNRSKFAVNNKVDFLKIFNFRWPAVIEGYAAEVTNLRILPDCFSLVVRYIPSEIKKEQAKTEIMKAIPTAIAFSTLKYQRRQRPTYDVRYNVPNIDHYDTALELGHLAIGHHYLSLTHFYSGCRLMYCTACWRIDHTRNQCQSHVCCRKCLEPYEKGIEHICSENKLGCAQCSNAHFSLDPGCPIIQNYKAELKHAVDDALDRGVIKRVAPGESSQTFCLQDEDFLPLKATNAGGGPGWHSPPDGSIQCRKRN
ncbi:unnamed protein product [Didymodactylos carnosus]|uniref:Uncharacterized protein n=1 Tax=Didymodactylos carnosus TaxID=1234261 RepID=A0A8S2QKJ8_9BILA|nr:unnamed protein product [Didymodactylos carnosus]CAF4118814.1 unnamed protein product [Didymodactylos carnosus]